MQTSDQSMKGLDVSVLDELHAVEQRIVARLHELQPVVAEYEELCAAARRLGIDGAVVITVPSEHAAAALRPRGTRAAGAERRKHVLDLIQAHPDITVPELSRALRIDPPPLYRVVRRLVADGAVVKRGTHLRLA